MLPEIEEGNYLIRFVYVDENEETNIYGIEIYASNRSDLDNATKTTRGFLQRCGYTVLKCSAKRKGGEKC